MTITADKKVVLSLRDQLVFICTLIAAIGGGIVYVERRVAAIEHENGKQAVVIGELTVNAERDRTDVRKNMNDLAAVVTDLRVVTEKLKTILDERKTTRN